MTTEWVLDKRWNIEECSELFNDTFIDLVRQISHIYGKEEDRARIILSVTATEHMFKVDERIDGTFSCESTVSTSDAIRDILPTQPINIFLENPFTEDVYNKELFANITWRKTPFVPPPCDHIITPKDQFDVVFTKEFLKVINLFVIDRGLDRYNTIRISSGWDAYMGGNCVFELLDYGEFYEVLDSMFGGRSMVYYDDRPSETIKISKIFKGEDQLKIIKNHGVYVHCEESRG